MRTSKETSKRFRAAVLLAVAGMLAGVAACDSGEDLAGAGGASNSAAPDAGPPDTDGTGGAGLDASGGHTGGAGASGDTGGTGGSANGAGGVAGSRGAGGGTGSGGAAGATGSGGNGRIKHV